MTRAYRGVFQDIRGTDKIASCHFHSAMRASNVYARSWKPSSANPAPQKKREPWRMICSDSSSWWVRFLRQTRDHRRSCSSNPGSTCSMNARACSTSSIAAGSRSFSGALCNLRSPPASSVCSADKAVVCCADSNVGFSRELAVFQWHALHSSMFKMTYFNCIRAQALYVRFQREVVPSPAVPVHEPKRRISGGTAEALSVPSSPDGRKKHTERDQK